MEVETSATFVNAKGKRYFRGSCTRCGGAGGYKHWPGFTCFRCFGNGRTDADNVRVYDDTEYVKVEARNEKARARREAKKVAEAASQVEANRATYGERFDRIMASTVGNGFIRDIQDKASRYDLTEKQVAAAIEAIERAEAWAREDAAKAEALDAAGPVTEGRRVIEGEVVTTKYQDSDYGSTLKMLVVQADGNKVWGTVPTIRDGEGDRSYIEIGDRVRFMAKVERSAEDEHFGFFSRPTKAEIVEREESNA
jgi:hypothetical protein